MEILERQRRFFNEGHTLDIRHRKRLLKLLRSSIIDHKDEILAALKEDLGKSETEAYMCEYGLVLSEISHTISHMVRWGRKRRVCTPLANFHSSSYVLREPYGNVLIMSPWNYPFLLCISPLICALAAGNTAVIKPSAYAPATSAAIKRLVEDTFTDDYVAVIEGGRDVNADLLEQKWDYIFFTGSKTVGRVVMGKAAVHLTPVTLELGGKSPVIVDEKADLKIAAARIMFGKYLNLGQTCVAPDHVFVHESVAARFLELCKEQMRAMYGENPLENEDYGKIISRKHYDRLCDVLDDCRSKLGDEAILAGGVKQDERLRISPTIVMAGHLPASDVETGAEVGTGVGAEVSAEAGRPAFEELKIMQDEIFGPLLPVISYSDLYDVVQYVNSRPRPLACYIFTNDSTVRDNLLEALHFGGGCVNDTVIHLATDYMPFGGVGESGMGNYHGKYGFDTFSHLKSITDKKRWIDLPLRYQPYTKSKLKMIRMFLK